MRMTQEEFRNERIYTATMVQVKKMLSLVLADEHKNEGEIPAYF